MQQLKNLIENSPIQTRTHLLNLVREYLQTLILKAVFQYPRGRDLSFMGGTCLRLCYGLKRFSEDLDFSRDVVEEGYSFEELHSFIERRLKERGFDVEVVVKPPKTVDRSFVRFPLDYLDLAEKQGQKLHIKLEVDNRPPPIDLGKREQHFLSRHNELFPILKHAESTLFAGKVLALLCRPQLLGRDCYDLIWYLQRRSACDYPFLKAGLKAAGKTGVQMENFKDLKAALKTRLQGVSPKEILNDIEAFLEDPSDIEWIQCYPEVLDQLLSEQS